MKTTLKTTAILATLGFLAWEAIFAGLMGF